MLLCKMRLAFILTVNLFARMTHPRGRVCFFNENARCTNPPRFHDPRPTPPGLRIFFQLKRASRKPFQIPCVFSSKTRLACNARVNLYDSRPTPPTFLVFFKENARRRNLAAFLGFTFIVFSQVQCVLGSQVSVKSM